MRMPRLFFRRMSDPYNHPHPHLFWDIQYGAHVGFSSSTVTMLALAYLYPTTTQPHIRCCKVKQGCNHRTVLDPYIAALRVGAEHHRKGTLF